MYYSVCPEYAVLFSLIVLDLVLGTLVIRGWIEAKRPAVNIHPEIIRIKRLEDSAKNTWDAQRENSMSSKTCLICLIFLDYCLYLYI